MTDAAWTPTGAMGGRGHIPAQPGSLPAVLRRAYCGRVRRCNISLETRLAIEEFETLAKGILLRGYYRPGGESGSSLRRLMELSHPALYPWVGDPDRIDTGALSYSLLRLPEGIESITQITVAREIEPRVAEDFDPVGTRARRRPTYRTGESSYVTAFGGGMTDLLDFISALTCFSMESDKMRARYSAYRRKLEEDPGLRSVWRTVEEISTGGVALEEGARKSILHDLSVEFRSDYASTRALDAALGGRLLEVVAAVVAKGPRDLKVVFSDRFGLVGRYSRRAKEWAAAVASAASALGAPGCPVHVVSSNRHSVANCLSPYLREFAARSGMTEPLDYGILRELTSGPEAAGERTRRDGEAGIAAVQVPEDMPFCQIISLDRVSAGSTDPRLGPPPPGGGLLINMDYAFGEEGFFLLNELFETFGGRIRSVFIMGKAGILDGVRGDMMLPRFFVKQGSGEVYDIGNCMTREDFEGMDGFAVHCDGPMLTVAGTFLQNSDVLCYFRDGWHALGVEMEGIPYAKAVMQARLRKRIRDDVAVGVVFYASDAPLAGDLLSVPMGGKGVGPVYAATIAILRSIFRLELSSPAS